MYGAALLKLIWAVLLQAENLFWGHILDLSEPFLCILFGK